jgi:hypothetical protein
MSHLRRSWLTLILFVAIASWAQAATYFVKNGGSDSADGLSDANAWANISKVNSTAFSAGDMINFRRGSTWTGTTLVIDSNGSSGNPVTSQVYDTGNAPIIQFASSPPTSRFTHAIQVIGDWNVVRDFLTRNAPEACIRITATADNNVVRNNEATACGLGGYTTGSSNLITQNSVHDLIMIVNDAEADTDYGAVCFWFEGGSADNNELSYNTGINCRADSIDYGADGGFVEVFAGSSTLTNLLIHHNYAEGTTGFFETGGNGGTASNVSMYYNVIYEVHAGLCFHDSGGFSITHTNITFEHNTYHKTISGGFRVFECMGTTPAWLTVRNNIFNSNIGITNQTGFTHTHNRYNMTGGATIGYTLGTGESSGSPGFVEAANGDLHLQSTSATRDAGTDLGYTLDHENNPGPNGSAL